MGSGRDVQRGTSFFCILTIPLTLAACATGRDLQPVATVPELDAIQVGQAVATAAAPGSRQPTDWWRVYRDPQLDRLVEIALHNAPTIAIASARIAQANAALGSAKAGTLPNVSGSVNALGEYFPDHYVYARPYAGDIGSQGDITADARYHLDFWARYRNATAASGARAEAAHAEARDAALLLQAALVESYVRLGATYRLRDVAASGLQRRQAVVDLLTLRTGAGLATDVDAVEAREAITSTRSEIARLGAEIARRRNEIAALLGKGPGYGDTLVRPTLSLIDDPTPSSAIPASLLGYRPDIAAQRARVEAAAKEIGVARAAFYPDVDVRAFAGLASIGLGQMFRSGSATAGVGPAVTLPIFDGGALRSTLRARNAEFDEAVANYEAAIATALQQVADAIVALRSERERLGQADAAIAHWNRVVTLQKIRERQGLSSSVERLSAETALLLAERDEGEARVRVAVAQVSMIRALGGAWTSRDQQNF